MPRSRCLIVPVLVGMWFCAPARAADIRIQAEGCRGKLYSTVQVNGTKLGLFTIDTGSSITTISHAAASKLKLQQIGSISINTFEGTKREPLMLVQDLQLDLLHLKDFPVAICNCAAEDKLSGDLSSVGGIGMDVLGRQPFAMDFREGTVTLFDPKKFSRTASKSFPLLHGAPTPCVRVVVSGHDGWFEIDSGYSDFLLLSKRFWKLQADLIAGHPARRFGANWGEQTDTYYVRVDSVSAFNDERSYPLVAYDAADRFSAAGLLGITSMQDRILTVDMAHDRAWLEDAQHETRDALIDRIQHNLRGGMTGNPPLIVAAKLKRLDALETLLKMGEPIDRADDMAVTPLMTASARGWIEGVNVLLANSASIDLKCKYGGMTALLLAAQYQRTEAARQLLDAGADANLSADSGRSALFLAAESGDLELVKLLVDRGASIDSSLKSGETPLLAACANGNCDVVRLLLAQGANSNTAGQYGTCLSYAAQYGSGECVKLLIAHKADVNAFAPRGPTPLMAATSAGKDAVECIRPLLAAGADASIKTAPGFLQPGRTAYDFAVEQGNSEAVKVLYERTHKQASTVP